MFSEDLSDVSIHLCIEVGTKANRNLFLIPAEIYVPPPDTEDETEIYHAGTSGINFDKYFNIPVKLTGADPVRQIESFDEAELSETCRVNVKKSNYTKPTPVQKYSIPIILKGRDLMACAQTGSGKTVS